MLPRCFYAENTEVFPGVIAKNKKVQEYEKFIHTTFYPYVIHPYSKFRVYWEIAVIVLYLAQLLSFVSFWMCDRHDSFWYQSVLYFMFFFYFTDIVLMFFTGYVEKETDLVILGPKRIARRYLLTTFLPDFLACIPVEIFFYFYRRDCVEVHGAILSKPCHFALLSSICGLYLRVFMFFRCLRNTFKIMFWNPFICSLIFMAALFFLVLHTLMIFVLIYFYTKHLEFVHFWETPYRFFLIEMEVIHYLTAEHNLDYQTHWSFFIEILLMLLYYVLFNFSKAFVIKYMRFKMKTTERFYTLENSIRIFARKRRLPISLKQKTFLYFRVFIHSKHYKENEIFNYFPETFKSEITSHLYLSLLQTFPPFENLPIYVLRRMAVCLKHQLYLPNELVFMKGQTKLRMYFIQSGKVALYSGNNTEIYHFDDGDCFNGKNFIEGKQHSNQYAISVEVSEIHVLDYEDFTDIMAAYPKLMKKIRTNFPEDMENPYLVE